MIQIYSKGNTRFDMNGDMVLFPESCCVSAELNGTWKMDMVHPRDHEGRWRYIEEECIISAPTFVGERQLFRICEIEKTDDDVTVVALPVFADCADDCYLIDVRPTNKNGQEALDIMTAGSQYCGESNITSMATAYFEGRSLLDAINGSGDPTFIGRWGGEILYDNYKIIINDRVGGDYGVEARYGKNMESIEYSMDMSGVVTRIIPVAYNGYKISGNTPWVDSQNIYKYEKKYIKKIRFEDIKMRADAQEDDEENGVIVCDTQAELNAALIAKCEKVFDSGLDLPVVSIKIDMTELSKTEEYKEFHDLETVGLGDDIKCRHKELDIETKERVIAITWDCCRNRVEKLTLGESLYDYFSSTSSSLKSIESILDQVGEIIDADGSIVAGKIKGFLDAAKTQLWYQKNVAQRQDVRAILFEDLDTSSPLYGAMALGTQGLQISKQRTADGRDWQWTTALTANGLIANIIVAGILSDKKGLNYWNLDTGEFSLSSTGFMIDGKETKEYFQDSWSQEDVLNKLTNNGKNKGIYMLNGELYMNASYIRTGKFSADKIYGGTLTLGGANNVSGKLVVKDSKGNIIGRWDNGGVYISGGAIHCKTDESGVTIENGKMLLTYGDVDFEVGTIGSNYWEMDESKKGLVFNLGTNGDYMAWGVAPYKYDSFEPDNEGSVVLMYARRDIDSFKESNLYVFNDTDFRDNTIKNAYIEGLRVRKSFYIPRLVTCDVYSDIDFHDQTIENVVVENCHIKNLISADGYTTVTGSMRVLTGASINSDGFLDCEYGTIKTRSGIVTLLR